MRTAKRNHLKKLGILLLTALLVISAYFTIHYRNAWIVSRQEADVLEEQAEQAELSARQMEKQIRELEDQLQQEMLKESEKGFEADPPAYQELYPDFYAPQELDASAAPDKTIYLTFDDGPSARTDEILKILEEKGIKATFFVIGQSDQRNLQRMKNITDAGHTLGMHSYTHKYAKIYASVEAYLEDMYQVFCQIREATGTTPTVFRLPGGSLNAYNFGLHQEILSEMLRRGFVPYDWNLVSGDATGVSYTAAQLTSNVVAPAAKLNRGVVLMHDSSVKKNTVAALGPMIDQLRDMGFQLEPITPATKPILFDYPK